MNFRGIALCAALLFAGGALSNFQGNNRADEAPATQPADTQPAGGIKTGEIDLTFTKRSPLSTPKEVARRLNVKSDDAAADYDLTSIPFKTYIPANYDSATPVGVFVYLGYKDSPSIPPLWKETLDKNHLIFITPVAHTGDHYPNSIPRWQTMGLALDAVFNLKQQYAIDNRRIYLMSWNDGSTQISFASADVFTGFIIAFDQGFCQKLTLPDGRFYTPAFTRVGEPLWSQAKSRAYYLISDTDGGDPQLDALKSGAMKRAGFNQVLSARLSPEDDLHYPMFKAEWFADKVLPFLDRAAAAGKGVEFHPGSAARATQTPSTGASTQDAPPTAANSNENAPAPAQTPAQHLMSLANLYIRNGQPDLARKKLQQLLEDYPTDPEALAAKKLLMQVDGR